MTEGGKNNDMEMAVRAIDMDETLGLENKKVTKHQNVGDTIM